MTKLNTSSTADVRALVLDIDGVLTDGTDRMRGEGKRLYLRDVDSLTRIRREGVIVAFLTGEEEKFAKPVIDRCGGGPALFGAKDKGEGIQKLAGELRIPLDQLCFIGDADRDVAAMKLVGLSFAPADASPRARAAAGRVLFSCGGRGAVEEAVGLVFEGAAIDTSQLSDNFRVAFDSVATMVGSFAARNCDEMAAITISLARCLRSRGQIVIFGDERSAAIAQHFAAVLIERLSNNRRPVPVIALTTDSCLFVTLANAIGVDSAFERLIASTTRFGDVVVGLSTSGAAHNVVRGLAKARKLRARTIALVGDEPGSVEAEADFCVTFPSNDPSKINELHFIALQEICLRLAKMEAEEQSEDVME